MINHIQKKSIVMALGFSIGLLFSAVASSAGGFHGHGGGGFHGGGFHGGGFHGHGGWGGGVYLGVPYGAYYAPACYRTRVCNRHHCWIERYCDYY